MREPRRRARASFRFRTPALGAAALALVAACSADHGGEPTATSADPIGVDTSRSVVQHGPRVDVAYPESSLPLRDAVQRQDDADEREPENESGRAPGKIHRLPAIPLPFADDPIRQSALPLQEMPVTGLNFLSQGYTGDPKTIGGTPPDTNGAVGPHHFVQAVNTALAIWDKAGHVVLASENFNTLWAGYTGTNPGNSCATQNDGDPVVVYDQLADRWFITQFSLPTTSTTQFQCVAVSKTGDPTGAYWLYDFPYPGLPDYGKFGIWPDAYYATFNMFTNTVNGDADLCAYDRVSMLAGKPATQQCFQQGNAVSGALPVSLEGPIPPPRGEPGYFLQLSDNQSLDLFKIHVDWATPANSTLTGPTNLKVTTYAQMCASGGGTCVPQPSPGNQVDALSDRLMFRLTYRNFGTHEALMVNHSVDVGSAGGVRWYEIRSPNGTPTVYQQGTYAPADGAYRWMASLGQDQSEAMALGFSISSTTKYPSVGWTGRLASDALGVMGQGESVIDTGSGVETGTFSDGTPATRWGDYSNITVDPVDDCTFWYTQELYHATGPSPRTWDTEVATVKFPSCAANDFSLGVTPPVQTVAPGAKVTYSVTTPKTKGTAETIALAIQDLPDGVTGAFAPASAPAGTTVKLTLTAAATAKDTTAPIAFTVIGKAPSAVHMATADLSIGTVAEDAGTDSGTDAGVDSGPIVLVDAGIDAGELDAGVDANIGIDAGEHDAGVEASTGTDAGSVDASAKDATGPAPDAAGPQDSGGPTGDDASVGAPDATVAGPDASGATADAAPGSSGGDAASDGGSGGGPGSSGGCGCRTAGSPADARWPAFGALAVVGVAVRRRRRSRR